MLSTHHPHGPWVICTLSLWYPETGDDIGDHIYVISISSTCHHHPTAPLTEIIHSLFHLFQMWSPLTVVIHRLSLWFLMWSPLREIILHYSLGCLHVIPMVLGDWVDIMDHICHQYIVCMSSPWSLKWSLLT